MSNTQAGGAREDKQTYEVEVFAPRNPADRRPFSWSKHMTVGDAAADAAPHFGIQGGQPTLAKNGKPLDRSKQLVAAGVRDGDVLEIVDAAGGVSMGLVAPEAVRAYLEAEDEIPGAIRWAVYHRLDYAWTAEMRTLTVHLEGGSERDDERERYLLVGTFEDYRVMPPSWHFLDPRTARDIGRAAYPAPGPFSPSSVLHTSGVICAPWNRLAYSDRGGPHSDWTQPTKWQSIAPQHTSANTIPEMLARIRAETLISPRRLAPLPPLNESDASL